MREAAEVHWLHEGGILLQELPAYALERRSQAKLQEALMEMMNMEVLRTA